MNTNYKVGPSLPLPIKSSDIKKLPELQSVSSVLTEEVTILNEVWCNLQSRLETVLRKEVDQETKCENRTTPCTEASARIDVEVCKIRTITKEIQRVTSLLEV
jgi:hypothetical protein